MKPGGMVLCFPVTNDIIDRYCLDAMGERLLAFIYLVISMSLFPYVHAGKLITSFAYPNRCYLVAIGMHGQCPL